MKEYLSDVKETVKQKFQAKKQSDLDRQERFKEEFQQKLDEQNKRLDAKVVQSNVKAVLDHLDRNMNKQFYDEKRADEFFEKVFAL